MGLFIHTAIHYLYLLKEGDEEGGEDEDGGVSLPATPWLMVHLYLLKESNEKSGRMAIERVSRTPCTLVNGLPISAQRRR